MVIQRWQTVMLLIAAVMMGLFSFCSLGQFQGADMTVDFTALRMTVEGTDKVYMHTVYLFVVSLLSTLLPLIAIFRFKTPKVQRKITWLAVVMVIATMATTVLTARFAEVPGADGLGYSSIAFAPFIALVALIVAIRCIGADIKRLSGYDRLR